MWRPIKTSNEILYVYMIKHETKVNLLPDRMACIAQTACYTITHVLLMS